VPNASYEEEQRRWSKDADAEFARLRSERLAVETEPDALDVRLWSALERSVALLERRLTEIEVDDPYFADGAGSANAVRNIAETLDRLGMLRASGHDPPNDRRRAR